MIVEIKKRKYYLAEETLMYLPVYCIAFAVHANIVILIVLSMLFRMPIDIAATSNYPTMQTQPGILGTLAC